MERHLLLVVSDPVEGRDADYNRWYTERHLADVLKIEGFVRAERFSTYAALSEITLPGRYVAIYEMECDDPMAVYERLTRTSAEDMPVTDSMKPDVCVTLLTPIAALERDRARA